MTPAGRFSIWFPSMLLQKGYIMDFSYAFFKMRSRHISKTTRLENLFLTEWEKEERRRKKEGYLGVVSEEFSWYPFYLVSTQVSTTTFT